MQQALASHTIMCTLSSGSTTECCSACWGGAMDRLGQNDRTGDLINTVLGSLRYIEQAHDQACNVLGQIMFSCPSHAAVCHPM